MRMTKINAEMLLTLQFLSLKRLARCSTQKPGKTPIVHYPLHFKVSRAVESQDATLKIDQASLMRERADVPKSTLPNGAYLPKIASTESYTGLYDGQNRKPGISDQQWVISTDQYD